MSKSKVLGWTWFGSLALTFAFIITRMHEWETVLMLFGIIVGIVAFFAISVWAIEAITDGGVDEEDMGC